MSPRRRFVLYLGVLHVLLAAVAGLLLRQDRLWLFAVEAVFVSSLTAGVLLTRGLFRPLALARESAHLLKEHDHTVRFREVGQPEVDELIRVYNGMTDSLREERIRLREQHHFLSQILEASPLGVLTLDFDGQVDFANSGAVRLLGLPVSELHGRRLVDLDVPLAAALADLAPGESRVVPVWGGRRVKCRRGAFVDRGFSRGFFLLEELTEELRRYEKAAYEKLIRMMSHEVNNSVGASNSLLHSCLTYATQLHPEDRRDFEDALKVVIGRTEQLSGFMRSFADVVRLPAPSLRPANLAEIIQDIARLMRPQSEDRGIEWRIEIDESVPLVSIDRGQVEQALVNVVKNALEAIGHEGRLTIRLGLQDGRAKLVVEDSGPGLSPEAQANLFTPFFSTKERGQGIGLTLVQEVLAQHRCEYSLEGSPGDPTRFTIVFPLGDASAYDR